jgi:uncharacterized protein involved in exopolysaccharide biosynthesis
MQQSPDQSEPGRNQRDYYEDEIDLFDLFRVIWKWKYLILIGALVFACIAAIISINSPKIYRVKMTIQPSTIIQPGIQRIAETGNMILSDSSQGIKSLIKEGFFNNAILDKIKEKKNKLNNNQLNFDVQVPRNTTRIVISFDTPFVAEGIKILYYLIEELTKNYSRLTNDIKSGYQDKIDKLNSEIKVIETQEKIAQSRKEYVKTRLNELNRNIKITEKNIEEIKEQKKLLKKDQHKDNQILFMLLNTHIQQQFSLKNEYYKQIDHLKESEEISEVELREKQEEKSIKTAYLAKIKEKKERIRAINIVNSPEANSHPIKPKIRNNILLGIVAGFMLMIFFSFIIEYLFPKFKGS